MDTNKIFIDIAQRAREFAEMCERMANETKQKADPEAWREDYRKKQAAGVKFEFDYGSNAWEPKFCSFTGRKEWYREVPQEVSGKEYARAALWKEQREVGTNEVWEEQASDKNGCWWDLEFEPEWIPKHRYRVKPMKLTAKIIRRGVYKTSYYWEFFGTREEYRAECEKYGYVVISEIKEVVEKPKTVKYYFALIRNKFGAVDSLAASSIISFNRIAEKNSYIIIGDIEEREIEA